MPWPTYSTRFLSTSEPQVWHSYYVPAGQRAVVQAISAVNLGETDGLFMVSIPGAVFAGRVIPAHEDHLWTDVRTVLYGGEALSVYMDTSACHMTVSGYLFRDPGGGQELEAVHDDPPAWVTMRAPAAAAG